MIQPSLRFILQEPALKAFKAEPPPPVALTKATRKTHRDAVKAHYDAALKAAIGTENPNRYTRAMFQGIIHRLKGRHSAIAKPLFSKNNVMPALRPWAEKHGLI